MGDRISSASGRKRPTRTSSVTRMPVVRPVDVGVPSPALREAALLGCKLRVGGAWLPSAPPVREAERLGALRASSPQLDGHGGTEDPAERASA